MHQIRDGKTTIVATTSPLLLHHADVDALAAVGGTDWFDHLIEGLDTVIGSGAFQVSPGQAEQIALARLILANPRTLVLDDRGDRPPLTYRPRC